MSEESIDELPFFKRMAERIRKGELDPDSVSIFYLPELEFELERIVQDFGACGIKVDRNSDLEGFLDPITVGFFKRDPYRSVAIALASWTIGEHALSPSFSPQLWMFKAKMFDGDGTYKYILDQMHKLAGRYFSVSKIKEETDYDENWVRLRFFLKKELIEWEFMITDDIVDTSVLKRIAELVAKHRPPAQFVHLPIDNARCVMAFMTAEQQEKLNQVTGLNFVPFF